MSVDNGLIGGAIGLLLALLECAFLLHLAARIEKRVATPSAPQTARILRIVAVLGLLLGAGLGYLIGRMLV